MANSKGNMVDKHIPNIMAPKTQAVGFWSIIMSKIVNKENMIKVYPERNNFFIDFICRHVDKNLNAVIEIQKIELYLVACYFVAISYKTA